MAVTADHDLSPPATEGRRSRLRIPPWNDLSLHRKGLVVVAFPLLSLLVASAAFFLALDEYRRAEDLVGRSLAVKAELRWLLVSVLEDQSSARGYLVTKDRRFLAPGAAARQDIRDTLKELDELIVDPDQRKRLARLPGIVGDRLAVSEDIREAAAASGPPENIIRLLRDGERLTQRARSHLDGMEAAELDLLERQRARAEKRGTAAAAAAVAGALLGLFGGTGATNLFTRGVTRRIGDLESNARRLEGGLSLVQTPSGRDEIGRLGTAMVRTSELLRAREAELIDAQSFLERLLSAAPTAVIRLTLPDLRLGYASPNLGRLFGQRVGRASALGEVIHPADLRSALPALKRVAGEPAGAEQLELRLVGDDGSYRAASAVVLADPGLPSDVLVYLTDIEDRARAERALSEREATLRAVFEASPEIITISDSDGTVRSVNQALERVLGRSPQTIIGQPAFDLLDPDDLGKITSALQGAAGGQPQPVRLRYRARHADGRWVHMDSHMSPLTGDDGKLLLVAVTRDVTEEVHLEQAREEARRAAEEANLSKSEFLSRMSHELRTPLHAVLGFAQLLELDDLPAEQEESVRHILKGGRHLLSLIDEVLDISRIESGRLNLSPEPVPVAEIVGEAADLIRPLAAAADVALINPGEGEGEGYVLADRQRLKQILLNLLSNAVKYNRPGGSVTIACSPSRGERCRIDVIDTGPGIAPEQLPKLFLPFERLGAEQTGVEGTGIGLTLSQRLAEVMGGSLGVISAPGEGSTFRVELPSAEGPVERYERLNGGDGAERQAARGRQATVLHIEDNPANIALVQRVLARRAHIELVAAMQGSLGLELARQHRPLLILLDVHLPDVEGEQVLRRLREDPVTAGIPVVIVSADATPGQVLRLLEAGAMDYLTKPVDVNQLLSILDEVLGDNEE